MADPAWRPPAAARPGRGADEFGLGLVEGETSGEDGVVAALDEGDQRRRERSLAPSCQVGGVAGALQQALHVARPVLLFDVDQRLQLAQVVRIAERVQHAGQRVVRLPMIMHDDAGETGQQAAAFGCDTIEGQQRGAGDVQPLRLAANAEL